MSDQASEPVDPLKYTASLDGWRDANQAFKAAILEAERRADAGDLTPGEAAVITGLMAIAHATKAGAIEVAIELNMARRYGVAGAKTS